MVKLSLSGEDRELQRRLSDELDAINNAAITSDDETPLSVRLTDDDGALLGGITGWTWGGCGGITSLWLAPEQRGQGWGGRLLAAAEEEIRRRGCDRVVVATMSFQAPGFYLRHGYSEVGRTPEMPDGTAKYHFHKRLDMTPECRMRTPRQGVAGQSGTEAIMQLAPQDR
jgi:ribosomal protein S18 acetylase RimI-like enzyme